MEHMSGRWRALVLVVLGAGAVAGTVQAGETPAEGAAPAAAAFEQLKALHGTWEGEAQLEGAEPEAGTTTHTFRVSSAGSVVMETMAPGTEHEMINMYHLDGDDLVVTHYCASGNQPRMRLAEVTDDGRTLRFVFDGGSNLDPATDGHIHEASLTLVDGDTVEESWVGYNEGEPAGTMQFRLERSE